jgi:hypothetical protein
MDNPKKKPRQHRVYKTKKSKTKITQYVLDTTLRKHTKIKCTIHPDINDIIDTFIIIEIMLLEHFEFHNCSVYLFLFYSFVTIIN